jgi:phosphate transport system substrate-binding protein
MFARPPSLLLASLSFVLAAIATVAVASPKHHRGERDNARPTLTVRGDQVTTHGVADAVMRAYRATGGRIEVQPFSTISGIDDALNGSVDIAATARPAYAKRPREAGLIFTPVAWSALALITNSANPVDNLTLKQVQDIYTGRITNWSQVGGEDEPIDLIGVATPLDGTQFSLRTLLFGDGDHWVAVPRLFINVDSLQQEVSLDDKALGISMLSYAHGEKGIKILSVEGVRPSLATLSDGTYPLATRLYLASRSDSPHAAAIENFMNFLSGQTAGRLLRDNDLLPFSDATALNARTDEQRVDAVSQRIASETADPGSVAPMAAPEYASASAVAQTGSRGAGAAQDPDDPVSYTVTRGDTLSKIAQKYSVSVHDLRTWNHLSNDDLQVGQVLIVSVR